METKTAALTGKNRGKLLGAAVAAAALAAGALPLLAGPAGAATAASPVLTFTGSAGALPAGSATVVVEAELARDANAKGVPQSLQDIPVAVRTISAAGFSVPVGRSAVLQQAEQQGHGNVNFAILIVSGTRVTAQYVPAPLTRAAAPGNTAALAIEATRVIRVPAFPAYRAVGAAAGQWLAALGATPQIVPPPCQWTTYGSQYQDRTRIGEVHVANATGVTDTFEYRNSNDLTISVGISARSPDGDFGSAGTITLTNSLSADGGETFGPGTVDYVNDTVNYQRYEAEGISCPNGPEKYAYKIQAVSTDSDVYPGLNTPPVNPWGGCRNDPLHATLASHASWALDNSRAEFYSTVANLFGFTFGGSDGFTTNVEHDYNSTSSSPTTYICGPKNGLPPIDAPVLYNTP